MNWKAMGLPKMAFVTIIFVCLALFLLMFSAGRLHAQRILRATPLLQLTNASTSALPVSTAMASLPGRSSHLARGLIIQHGEPRLTHPSPYMCTSFCLYCMLVRQDLRSPLLAEGQRGSSLRRFIQDSCQEKTSHTLPGAAIRKFGYLELQIS